MDIAQKVKVFFPNCWPIFFFKSKKGVLAKNMIEMQLFKIQNIYLTFEY